MSDDILFTPEEIAQKLKLKKATVYEMIKRGDLDAHHIGKNIRISDSQFKLYLLKTKGNENIYEAEIAHKDNETIANIGTVSIYVNSEFEGVAKISISPEDIILSKGTFLSSARNIHKGTVKDFIIDGTTVKVMVDIGIPLIAFITEKSLKEMNIEKGTELYAVFKTFSVRVLK